MQVARAQVRSARKYNGQGADETRGIRKGARVCTTSSGHVALNTRTGSRTELPQQFPGMATNPPHSTPRFSHYATMAQTMGVVTRVPTSTNSATWGSVP